MNKRRTIITNCEKATFLIEKQQLVTLSFIEALTLKIHLSICSVCRIYQKQSRLITKIVHKIFHVAGNPASKLDDEYKKEIQQRIDEKIRKN